jgi:hypothetical protein
VPTPQALVERMLDMAALGPEDLLMDLGSGDGRTVISAARRGAKAIGVEYNPDMVELSKRNAAREGVQGKASFVKADLFETDFSKATVITMFLLPDINLKLRPKLLGLKPGTRIVSTSFGMDDWEPDRTDRLAAAQGCDSPPWCSAHLWIVPANFEGTYALADGDLTLRQRFQALSGVLKTPRGVELAVRGSVKGLEAFFRAGGRAYRAKKNGSTLELLP